MKLKVFNTQEEVLRSLTEQIMEAMQRRRDPFHLALSGAGTARKMYKIWISEYLDKINWDQLRFYWVDERCVDPQDEESNYKHASELLFSHLDIPATHIHRIHGEKEPEIEAVHYSEMVKWELPGYACIPRFDCIILGIGTDGHTASIFPQNPALLTDQRCYAVAEHPESGQFRITMTGTLILNGKMILIPVIGTDKPAILQKVINSSGDDEHLLPAAYIISHAKNVMVFTDSKISIE